MTGTLRWADSNAVTEGQRLTVIGYPGVGDYDVVDVNVRSVDKDTGELRVTSGLDHGDSGAAALTERGEVAGIVRASSVVDSIEPFGVLIPSALANVVVANILARPDRSPIPAVCQPAKSPATQPVTTTSGTREIPGEESRRMWIAQIGSSDATRPVEALVEDMKRFQRTDSSTKFLFTNDWQATFTLDDRVIFYIGGFRTKDQAVSRCTQLALSMPNDCLVRQLIG